MANHSLFASARARATRPNALNREGAPAYAYGPEHALAQMAATGTLQDNFYSGAEVQLAEILAAARAVSPEFVAKAAVFARERGAMKDMPALLAAFLTVAAPELAPATFRRVIDSGRMLRTFVQILRSGAVGRTSLGTMPKRLVCEWLEQASMPALMRAATGNAPSLGDVVRMVHPKPADPARRAFYGWLLGRPYDLAALPAEVAAFEAWKRDRALPLPPVPFEWLTAAELTAAQWAELSERMGWQGLRINLNTLARHGAFAVPGTAERVAARLGDPQAAARARVMPYQLLVALDQIGPEVPREVRAALERTLDASFAALPQLPGRVVVCPDVSGSMQSPVTGYRLGATSKVRCVDVAALVASALLRTHRRTRVLPFEHEVATVNLSRSKSVAENAARLAAVGGGGTNLAAPLAWLNRWQQRAELVVIVSDNQSWLDPRRADATAAMVEWNRLKSRCPRAKLVCIDLQPYGTSQTLDREDILNVGGFSDAVFETLARFATGAEKQSWVAEVEATQV